jgi:23S rRNA (adenine2503-C2)-methyltransferase
MKDIYGLTMDELTDYLVSSGEKKFKATQIFNWLYKKRVTSFDEMSNVGKELILKLKQDFYFGSVDLIDSREGDLVTKYLFELKDKNRVEAVLMYHDYGTSLCISTEVGCNMSCAFCESGRLKKVRGLEPSEMVEQILIIEALIHNRITHVVLMGIGEPFDNYDNIINFIDIINNPQGIELGARHITVSTCGIVPKIKEFADKEKQVNLAISLHAPNNELRTKLMPINKVYPLEQLIPAVKEYIKKTNRRVTFEYIMLKGVNDSVDNAKELAHLLRGMNAYVNLIPYNETSHFEFKRSEEKTIMAFYDTLKKNNIDVTIRREFGGTEQAACGQLRSNYEESL